MNNIPSPKDRHRSEDIANEIRNEVQETLLLRAPGRWPDERLETVEKLVMEQTKQRLDQLADHKLLSFTTLVWEAWIARSKTNDMIRNGK